MLAILLNTTTEVSLNSDFNWTIGDYLMAIFLIGTMISLIYLSYKKTKNPKYRTPIIVGIVLFVFLIWVDLGVGLFGLPWSGS